MLPTWPIEINYHSPQANGLIVWHSTLANVGFRNLARGNQLATVVGSPSWTGDSVMGGAALVGASDGFYTIDSGISSNNPFTFSLWVRPSALVNNTNYIGGQISYNAGTTILLAFLIEGYTAPRFRPTLRYYDEAWATKTIFGTTACTVGGLMHLACVSLGSSGTLLYQNGQYVASGVAIRSGLSSVRFYSGSASSGLVGRVYDLRVYNRALSAGDIAALYAPATRWNLCRSPWRRWYSEFQPPTFISAWAAHSNAQIGTGVN